MPSKLGDSQLILRDLLDIRDMEPRELYTTSEVAQILGVHRVTVCRMVFKKELKALRRGRAIIGIPSDSLSRFLHERNGE